MSRIGYAQVLSAFTLGALGALCLLVSSQPASAALAKLDVDYVEIVSEFARGDRDEALDHLLEFEQVSVPDNDDKQIETLDKRQQIVARRLAQKAPESLVPLVWLHEAAYLEHLAAKRIKLAVHSRRRAAALIEQYIRQSRRPDRDRLASDLLTSLGGYLQQASMASVAISLYDRALGLDQRNSVALLGLAGLFERQGSYEQTIPYLEELLRVDPSNREARLRYGINLLRMERPEEGMQALQELRDLPQEDWILSLTYQEMARFAAGRGDLDRAHELLDEATGRLAEDTSLAVQVAYLTSRVGARQRAADLSTALEASSRSSKPSPRSLYSRVSSAALIELRGEIQSNVDRRVTELDDALNRSGARPEAAP